MGYVVLIHGTAGDYSSGRTVRDREKNFAQQNLITKIGSSRQVGQRSGKVTQKTVLTPSSTFDMYVREELVNEELE